MMRESPIGIVIALLATFGLGAGSIWWAYQFGFGTHSSDVQSVQNSSNSVVADSTLTRTAPVVTQSPAQQKPTPVATPTLTPTPEPVKKVDEVQKLPIQKQVQFVIDSTVITSEGQKALELLTDAAVKYTAQDVIIRINIAVEESEFSQTLAQQRAEEIAGIVRDKGFTKKIIISKKNNSQYTKKTRNKPVEISLIPNPKSQI